MHGLREYDRNASDHLRPFHRKSSCKQLHAIAALQRILALVGRESTAQSEQCSHARVSSWLLPSLGL